MYDLFLHYAHSNGKGQLAGFFLLAPQGLVGGLLSVFHGRETL